MLDIIVAVFFFIHILAHYMVKYHIDISIDCVHIRNGLQDYGIELNIRELDEVFSYFGKCVCVWAVYMMVSTSPCCKRYCT